MLEGGRAWAFGEVRMGPPPPPPRWDLLERHTLYVARKVAPIWRGWDWATGRSTLSLAWALFVITGAGRITSDIRSGDWVDLGFAFLNTGLMAWALLVTGRKRPDDGLLRRDVAIAASYFMTLAALAELSLLLSLAAVLAVGPSWNLVDACLTLVLCHAALADQPGSGKTCLARAADKLRSFSFGWRVAGNPA